MPGQIEQEIDWGSPTHHDILDLTVDEFPGDLRPVAGICRPRTSRGHNHDVERAPRRSIYRTAEEYGHQRLAIVRREPGSSYAHSELAEVVGVSTATLKGRLDELLELVRRERERQPTETAISVEPVFGHTMRPPDDDGPFAWARWLLGIDESAGSLLREAVIGLLLVVCLGLLLFGISGVWPPLVAVEGGSMAPNLSPGDLVFVVDSQRFASDYAVNGTGIVTAHTARRSESASTFGMPGDVIVFRANGEGGPSTIHRAHFWVDDGENWYERADRAYVDGRSCKTIPNCPAPHSGFITKGDAVDRYDQVNGVSEPVRPSWIHGRAEFRIPFLGHVRLGAEELLSLISGSRS